MRWFREKVRVATLAELACTVMCSAATLVLIVMLVKLVML